jgi:NSS family neurotransmitter:Na+ symporter
MDTRGKWGSKFGFVLAAAGSAVGLGNIWRFPYAAGKNGGFLFVFFYLLSILLIGLPVLIAETSLGRFSGKNPVGAFKKIKPKGPWKLVGYLGVFTGIMILSYYTMIAGWSIGYLYKAVTGKFKAITSAGAENMYNSFTADSLLQILLLGIFLALTIYVVSRGVSGGIEKFSKILMPALLVILILLLVRSLTLSGASEGLEFYLKPDFSKLNAKVIIEAMGQAFFSLSLGMGAMITYGSYLSKKENLPSATTWVVFFDTFIAIMAGFIIFPALFSQGMDPAAGEGIMFNILPVLFAKMPGGTIFGPLFFLLLCIAALTSTVSLLEVATAYCIDEKKWNRKKSAILVGVITFFVGIPSVLSYGNIKFFKKLPLINISFFALMDKLWSELALSIGALFTAIFVGYVWKTSSALKEINQGTKKYRFAFIWRISVKFLSPLLIIAILALFFYNLFVE